MRSQNNNVGLDVKLEFLTESGFIFVFKGDERARLPLGHLAGHSTQPFGKLKAMSVSNAHDRRVHGGVHHS